MCIFASLSLSSRCPVLPPYYLRTLRQCHVDCAQNCSSSYASSISAYWCATPTEPISWCEPPSNCTDDCSHECLDPTLLLATDPECEEYKYRKAADGSNMTIVSLPLSFNVSSAAICARNVTQLGTSTCPKEHTYHNITEHVRHIYVTESCIRRCFERCVASCFQRYCVTSLEEPVNDTAICLPRCYERFLDENEPDLSAQGPSGVGGDSLSGGGGQLNGTNCYGGVCYNGNVSDCQAACDADCVSQRGANCTKTCDVLEDPNVWSVCLSGCLANASAVCAPDCLYVCTGNHSLAYGYPRPYDASGDYYTLEDLHARLGSLPDPSVVGPWDLEWGNTSTTCHANCTYVCARACFLAVQSGGVCDAEAAEAAEERRQAGLPALHPRVAAAAHNNCTYATALPCLSVCRSDCTERCANLTDVVPQEELLTVQLAQVYDGYVSHCEDKCRVQIYGRNASENEECFRYDSANFYASCISNCTDAARVGCANVNITVDITHECNSTCIHLYIDPDSIRVINASELAYAYDLPPPPPPPNPDAEPFNLNARYDECMDLCRGNYTTNPAYLCDGGTRREEALVKAHEYFFAAEAGLGRQGITPQEQLQIDYLRASVPKGEVCIPVDQECVFNATRTCDSDCAEQVAYFHELCVLRYQVRRNASFEYNISSCHHPDGWRIGTEKWRYYAERNASDPLAQPRAHRGDALWEFDDVSDNTIMNCTCQFYNESFDPRFVAAILEYEMRPYRSSYLSTCMCLYNASAGAPQHCVHSNFSNLDSIFDWVFGNRSGADAVDALAHHSDLVGSCPDGCVQHCVSHCGAYFVEHLSPDDARWGEPRGRWNGTMFYPRRNATFRMSGFPSSLTDWNQTQPDGTYVVTRGHWRSDASCFDPCIETCAVDNCTAHVCERGCEESAFAQAFDGGRLDGNTTAQAFGCFWNATHEEGRPLCGLFCECHHYCVQACTRELPLLNTSAQMISHLASCSANCSVHCEEVHDERCANITALRIAALRPKYVNKTEVCLTSIYPTCALHCLGVESLNVTRNNSLFPASMLPLELRELNVTAGFDPNADEGYECQIVPCVDNEPCNSTALKVGFSLVTYSPTSSPCRLTFGGAC